MQDFQKKLQTTNIVSLFTTVYYNCNKLLNFIEAKKIIFQFLKLKGLTNEVTTLLDICDVPTTTTPTVEATTTSRVSKVGAKEVIDQAQAKCSSDQFRCSNGNNLPHFFIVL